MMQKCCVCGKKLTTEQENRFAADLGQQTLFTCSAEHQREATARPELYLSTYDSCC